MIHLVTLPAERTTGVEICKAAINELSIRQIDILKVIFVTTDGAPSMIGKEAGFINQFAKHVGLSLIGFHCIIHEETICAKPGLKELYSTCFK